MLGRIGAYALILTLGLGLAEAGLRLREGPDQRITGTMRSDWPMRPDPLVGWSPYPKRDVWNRSSEYDVIDRYNSFGLLGEEVTLTKPADTFRLLALGDSMTEGRQVRREQRFVTLIGEALTASLGRRVESLNAGRAGYQTDQELLYYEREGRELRPDLVLLFFFGPNDVMGNTQLDDGGAPKPRFRYVDGALHLEGTPVPPPPAISFTQLDGLLTGESALYRFGRVVWSARIVRPPCRLPRQWEVFRKEITAETADAWRLTTELVRRLAATASADGARFAIVNVPGLFPTEVFTQTAFEKAYCLTFDDIDPYSVSRSFAQLCLALAVPCLDVTRPLREAPATPPIYIPGDNHLSPEGHRLLAQHVLAWLDRTGLASR